MANSKGVYIHLIVHIHCLYICNLIIIEISHTYLTIINIMLAAIGFLIECQFMYLNIDQLLLLRIISNQATDQQSGKTISNSRDQSAISETAKPLEGISSRGSFGLNQHPVWKSLLPSWNMVKIIIAHAHCLSPFFDRIHPPSSKPQFLSSFPF